jgi:hypothetical protein
MEQKDNDRNRATDVAHRAHLADGEHTRDVAFPSGMTAAAVLGALWNHVHTKDHPTEIPFDVIEREWERARTRTDAPGFVFEAFYEKSGGTDPTKICTSFARFSETHRLNPASYDELHGAGTMERIACGLRAQDQAGASAGNESASADDHLFPDDPPIEDIAQEELRHNGHVCLAIKKEP